MGPNLTGTYFAPGGQGLPGVNRNFYSPGPGGLPPGSGVSGYGFSNQGPGNEGAKPGRQGPRGRDEARANITNSSGIADMKEQGLYNTAKLNGIDLSQINGAQIPEGYDEASWAAKLARLIPGVQSNDDGTGNQFSPMELLMQTVLLGPGGTGVLKGVDNITGANLYGGLESLGNRGMGGTYGMPGSGS